MVLWYYGIMVLRYYGIMVLWYYGIISILLYLKKPGLVVWGVVVFYSICYSIL